MDELFEKRQAVVVVRLASGDVVPVPDDQAWAALAPLAGLIARVGARFRSHWEWLPEGEGMGHFLSRGLSFVLGAGGERHFLILGRVVSVSEEWALVRTWKYSSPELVLLEEEQRKVLRSDTRLLLA